MIVPHTFIHTVHPHWVYGTTLVYWWCPCHHVISSTAVKAIPSLKQEVVANSNVVCLYCVVSWSFILIYNRAGWTGVYIYQNNWKKLIEKLINSLLKDWWKLICLKRYPNLPHKSFYGGGWRFLIWYPNYFLT